MTQNQAILHDLKSGEVITQFDALQRYRCMRLAARVAELRAQGFDVRTEPLEVNGRRFAGYWLPQAELFGGL